MLDHSYSVLVVVIVLVFRTKGHSAKYLTGFGRPDRGEMPQRIAFIVVAIRCRRRCSFKKVGDLYQFVRIGTLIAVGADG